MNNNDIGSTEKNSAIFSLFKCDDMKQRQLLFCCQNSLLNGVRFIFFDHASTNIDSTFDALTIQEHEDLYEKFHLYGIGDYTKAFLIDRNHAMPGVPNKYEASKTAYFDLNILIDLHQLLTNQNSRIDREKFKKYLNYLKSNGFLMNIDHAVLERVATLESPSSEMELRETVKSYCLFLQKEIGDFDITNITLTEKDNSNMTHYLDERIEFDSQNLRDYCAICCLIEKAYLIKKDRQYKSNKQRVVALVEYSLYELFCNMENELLLLSKYLFNEQSVNSFFHKLDRKSKIVEEIRNTAWDMYQLRLLEFEFAKQNCHNYNQLIFPYYATHDQGLSNIIELNPVLCIALDNGVPIPFHKYRVNDIIKNYQEMVERAGTEQFRKGKAQEIDYMAIRNNLEKRISELSI